MVPNRNLHIYNEFTLGSPPPTIPCPYCLRHFRSRGGRTKHIRAHHANESEPQEPNAFMPSSPITLSSSKSPSPPQSPIPSDSTPQPPSAHTPPPLSGYIPSPQPMSPHLDSIGLNLDARDARSNSGYMSPNIGDEIHEGTPLRDGASDPHAPDSPSVTRTYHPKMNGKLIVLKCPRILTSLCIGRILDENGNVIPLGTPPPPRESDKGPDNWTPYNNRIQFEVADFLFRRNQMSAGDINFLLNLWAASLLIHNDDPPFTDAKDLYTAIDSIPLGDVAWESFSLQYNGTKPAGDILPWMQAEYDVWFRDPLTLVHNLLSNPDFKSGFDYAPYQEHTTNGVHRFHDFMSANWAWNQAVHLRHWFL